MRQGIFAGETKDQLIQRVRGTKAHNFEDGIMAISRRGGGDRRPYHGPVDPERCPARNLQGE
jgi:hypothetical protein